MTQISLPCSPTPAEEDLRSSNQNPDAPQFTWFEPRSNRWPAALVAAGIMLASAAAVGYLATRPPGYDFRRDPGGFDAGVRTAQGYAAGAAVADWLAEGLPGRAARTVEVYRDALRPILDLLSARPTRRWSWSRTRVDPNQIACLELP